MHPEWPTGMYHIRVTAQAEHMTYWDARAMLEEFSQKLMEGHDT